MTSHLLQLHLEKELRGQAAVAAEPTDRPEITNCRETRKQTNSSQRDSDSSEEIFKGQLVDLVTFSLSCPVVMKALYLTASNSVFTHMYFTTEIL